MRYGKPHMPRAAFGDSGGRGRLDKPRANNIGVGGVVEKKKARLLLRSLLVMRDEGASGPAV